MEEHSDARIREFDVDQPGILGKATVTRGDLAEVCEILGIDPRRVKEVRILGDKVLVEAFIFDVQGRKILPHHPDDEVSGYLKHTYIIRVVDEEEAS